MKIPPQPTIPPTKPTPPPRHIVGDIRDIANSDRYGDLHSSLCATQRDDGDECDCPLLSALADARESHD